MIVSDVQARRIQELRSKGYGYKAIASAIGLSRDAVRYFCKANGLDNEHMDVQSQPEELCPNCGKGILQPHTGRKRKFCSDACRRSWWAAHPTALQQNEEAVYQITCAGCGKVFLSYGNRHRRYCGHGCYVQNRFRGLDGKKSELS